MNASGVEVRAPLANFLAAVVCTMVLSVAAPAVGYGTQSARAPASASQERAKVEAFIERQDVRRQMELVGVDPTRAQTGLSQLSDSDLRYLAVGIDELAMSDGAILSILLLAMAGGLVLLITDFYGITNIFSIVNRTTKR